MTPTILYLVTEDWYFCSHRLPVARAARDAGARIIVATRVADHGAAIEREDFALRPLPWRRGSLAPLSEASSLAAIRRLYRSDRPDLSRGLKFVDSPRHTGYVDSVAFTKYLAKVARAMGWRTEGAAPAPAATRAMAAGDRTAPPRRRTGWTWTGWPGSRSRRKTRSARSSPP